MMRFMVLILITASSHQAVFTSDTPNCLTEIGSQRTEVSVTKNTMGEYKENISVLEQREPGVCPVLSMHGWFRDKDSMFDV